MNKEIVMYGRSYGCPYMTIAKMVFEEHAVEFREIFIDKDAAAENRVVKWTGFKSVPTIVVTPAGQDLPLEEPPPLPHGQSPRGIDRGAMITEPDDLQLVAWLQKHEIIAAG